MFLPEINPAISWDYNPPPESTIRKLAGQRGGAEQTNDLSTEE
jgi:hypothetical protein